MQNIEAQGKSVDAEAAEILKSMFDGIRSHYEDHAKEDHSVIRIFKGEDSYEEIRLEDVHRS